MAAPTNTLTTATSIGNREDLEDVIYRVAPEETPFYSNIGKTDAKAIYHEWQTENLAPAVATNANPEGNTFVLGTANLTTRLGNTCQIPTKVLGVSETEDAVKKAGRSSETNRQKVLKGIEARRDFEMTIIGNNASVPTGNRATGGALAWMVTNTSLGVGGANGGFATGTVAAATNGTTRPLTETLVKAVMASAFAAGGKPTQAYMGPIQKQEFSAFTGIATIRHEAPGEKMTAIIGAADVYVSDFGNLMTVPHPYGLGRDVLGIDPKMWAVGVLRGWQSEELAKVSDSTQYAILMEGCLVSRNERSSFAIRDLI